MATKEISYRRLDRLRTRQRDSSLFKTAEKVYTRKGLKGGSLGVSYTDTAPAGGVGALDSFPDSITKINRAQAIKPARGTYSP